MLARLLALIPAGLLLAPTAPRVLAPAAAQPPAAKQPAGTGPRPVVQAAHLDPVNAVAFSQDGRLVATAGDDRTAKVWHVETGKLLYTLAGTAEPLGAVAFSHDGKLVATGGADKWVRVSDAVTGRRVRQWEEWVNGIRALAFSPDHKLLAAAGGRNLVHLRDPATGKSVRELGGHATEIQSLAFSPNGNVLACGGAGPKDAPIRLWNPHNGNNRTPKDLAGHHGGVLAMGFSPDGKTLASAGADGTAKLWSVPDGRLLATLKGHRGKVTGVGFVDKQTVVTSGNDKTVRFWDAATGEPADPKAGKPREMNAEIRAAAVSRDGSNLALVFPGRAALFEVNPGRHTVKHSLTLDGIRDRGYSAAISPDGTAIAVGGNKTVTLWRPTAARPLITFTGRAGPVYGVAFSRDGKRLAAVATNDEQKASVDIWDVTTGKHLDGTFAHSAAALGIAFSPDGKYLATASHDRGVGLWHVDRDGKLHPGPFKLEQPKPVEQFYSVAFSPDGKHLAAGSFGRVIVWDVPSGKLTPGLEFKDWEWRQYAVAFSPDSKILAAGSQGGHTRLWDMTTGKRRGVLEPHPKREGFHAEDIVGGLAFNKEGTVLAVAANHGVRLWDITDRKDPEHRAHFTHAHTVRSVGFTADGRYLLTGSGDIEAHGDGDGLVKIWEYGSGKDALAARPLCSLVSFWDADAKREDWAVTDGVGRYDASRGGDVPWLHFVINGEPVELPQIKERYYEPRLLARHLGLNGLDPKLIRDVTPLTSVKPPPKVEVKPTEPKKVTVAVKDQGGGVGRVQVFVNNKELKPEAVAAGKGGELTVDLSKAPLRGKGDKVRVVTWTKDGNVSSGRGAEVELADDPAPPKHAPELYAIVVGVSAYKNPDLNLQFAAKDAEDVAAALRVGAERLFGAKKVHLTILSSTGNKGTQPATRKNIEDAFTAARAAHPDDVLVVFMAGHGLGLPDQDLYCYLTADAISLNPRNYAAAAVRDTTTVSSEALAAWINQVPALKQMLVLDTCAAGQAAVKLTERRDVGGTRIRAAERITDRTGFHVLMGCAADRVSYEATRYRQGLLTYALLEGMAGGATDAGGRVNVTRLLHYVWDRVPVLAHDIGGVQQPHLSAPHASPFVVCEFNKTDPGFRLERPHPIVIRPRLLTLPALADPLGLQPKLGKQLFDAAQKTGAKLVFVDVEEMRDAVRPVGSYEVAGDKVTVKLQLHRDDKVVETLAPITGTLGKPDELAEKVAAAVREHLPKLKEEKK